MRKGALVHTVGEKRHKKLSRSWRQNSLACAPRASEGCVFTYSYFCARGRCQNHEDRTQVPQTLQSIRRPSVHRCNCIEANSTHQKELHCLVQHSQHFTILLNSLCFWLPTGDQETQTTWRASTFDAGTRDKLAQIIEQSSKSAGPPESAS